MAQALNPISLNDGILNQSQIVRYPINTGTIEAIRIYNDSPYYILLQGMPGCSVAWMPPGLEDLYKTKGTESGLYNLSSGYFNFTQKDFSLVPQITSAVYNLFVTFYEVGDFYPENFPIVHTNNVNVGNNVVPIVATLVNSQTPVAGGAGSISISAPNDSFGNQYYTCLSGICMRVGPIASGTATNNTVVSGFLGGINLHDRMDAITGGPSALERNFTTPLRSASAGSPANTITFSFPATTNWPTYSMDMWGFGLKAANVG